MGIYDSKLSCWERRKLGLEQDNAGPTKVEKVIAVPENELLVGEDIKEEVEVVKPTSTRKQRSKTRKEGN